jgi:hypothetical protein
MSNGSENNDVENDQSADSRKGSDESKVPSRWIIIFTVMSGVVMGLVFFQFVRTWPPCDVPTADAPPATAQTAAPALSAGKPGLTWVQPQSGVAAGNQQVKIIGVGLATASSASFGEAAAKILPGGDDTSISITTPAHKPGKVDVVVVTSAGQKLTLADAYTYLGDLPSITTISPATLPIDGGVMNIGGTNFLQNAIVSIGGIPSRSVNVDSSTSITAMAP